MLVVGLGKLPPYFLKRCRHWYQISAAHLTLNPQTNFFFFESLKDQIQTLIKRAADLYLASPKDKSLTLIKTAAD